MTEPEVGAETRPFLDTLNTQRNHVLGILDGLSDDDLRRPVLPSGWSCLGLVQHLAIDVERFWFREIFAGQSMESEDSFENAWKVSPAVPVEVVLDRYRREIELANSIITSSSLDAAPAAWPVERWPDWRFDDLRQTLLHVIWETACHTGHLDAVRELIDGRQWLVLTD